MFFHLTAGAWPLTWPNYEHFIEPGTREALRNIGVETNKPEIFLLATNKKHNDIQTGLRSW